MPAQCLLRFIEIETLRVGGGTEDHFLQALSSLFLNTSRDGELTTSRGHLTGDWTIIEKSVSFACRWLCHPVHWNLYPQVTFETNEHPYPVSSFFLVCVSRMSLLQSRLLSLCSWWRSKGHIPSLCRGTGEMGAAHSLWRY